jgi:acyl CoA:acetate/3-ketoacid CoA transferase
MEFSPIISSSMKEMDKRLFKEGKISLQDEIA